MPVLEILDKGGRLVRGNRAGVTLFSTMLYPSDGEKRDAYVAAVFQVSMLTQSPETPIPADIARLTFESGGKSGIEKDAISQLSHGLIAGETLLCVLQLADFAREHASLRKARFVVRKFRINQKCENRLSIPASISPTERAWSKFRSAAHLWAAFIPWWKEAKGNYVLGDDRLPDILANAKWFADAATRHSPPHSQVPILDPSKLWTVPDSPDIPNVKLKPPRMSETERDWLQEYDSTWRHKLKNS